MVKRVGLTYRLDRKIGPYADAVRAAGLEPVLLLPPGPASIAGLDGLVVTGGTDLDSALYAASRHATNDEPDRERDQMELRLLSQALEADLPFLGICRGAQLMNVAHGGDLIQNLETGHPHSAKNVHDVHQVEVAPDTKLAAVIGSGRHSVNSRHHQAAGRPGAGLVVAARSIPDGVIEGVERPDLRFAIAVQWHPEDRFASAECDRKLFAAFAQAVGI